MRAPLSASIAIATGLVVLIGYFVPLGFLNSLRVFLIEWGVVLAGVAVLIGIANLYYVHWRKMTAGDPKSVFSAVLVVSLTATLLLVGSLGPAHPSSLWLFNYVQVPIESSLVALLAVILVYAGARMLGRRLDLSSAAFIITLVIVLLATGPLFGLEVPGLAEFRSWIAQVPATAGARGILIGIALGVIATGLRILMGADRPYSG